MENKSQALKKKELTGLKSQILDLLNTGGMWEFESIRRRIHQQGEDRYEDHTFRVHLGNLVKRGLLYRPLEGLYVSPGYIEKRGPQVKDFKTHYARIFSQEELPHSYSLKDIQRTLYKTSLVCYPLAEIEEHLTKHFMPLGLVQETIRNRWRWNR